MFDVDLGDGGPILKLPFSEGNDPVEAALDFLRKHNLPLGYLGNVIDFIRKSTSSNHAPVNTSDLFSSEKKKQGTYILDSALRCLILLQLKLVKGSFFLTLATGYKFMQVMLYQARKK